MASDLSSYGDDVFDALGAYQADQQRYNSLATQAGSSSTHNSTAA